MSVKPTRKKSKAVFWIATMVIGSLILATTLLANNMRNLRSIASRYHLSWPAPLAQSFATAAPLKVAATMPGRAAAAAPPEAPERTAEAAPAQPAPRATPAAPPNAQPAPPAPVAVHIFDPPIDALRGAFLRTWTLSGPKLCADLVKAGKPVGDWQQSPLDGTSSECSYETRLGRGDQAASFFIIVRGTPSGEIANVRIKVIIPDTADGRAMGETFIDAVVMLLTETRWLDFQDALGPIGKLQDVTLQSFGAKLAFFREFQDSRAFNLQMELKQQTSEQIRTATVFDKRRWTLPAAPVKADR